jgi:4-hydroxy-tetrahydrodipicolinate synthase
MGRDSKMRGIYTALVTPFNQDKIDVHAWHKILDFQKKNKIHGVVVGGTTGESPTLTGKDLELLISLALEYQSSDFQIVLGLGGNDTLRSSERAKRLLDNLSKTPDAVMSATPYYNKPNAQGVEAHFNHIAKAIFPIPLCLYNVPGRTSIHLEPLSFQKILKENSNCKVLKEASGNLQTTTEFVQIAQEQQGISILSGDDPLFIPGLLCGCQGLISVSSNIIPHLLRAVWDAFEKKDFDLLNKLHLSLFRFHQVLFCAPNPIPVKWLMQKQGLCHAQYRLPLVALENSLHSKVINTWQEVQNIGISSIS